MDQHALADTLKATLHYAGTPSTSTVTPTAADLQGLINPTFFVAIGQMAAASPNANFSFTLEESDSSGSGFTAVSGDDMVTDPDSTQPEDVVSGVFLNVDVDNDQDVYRVTYKGLKRYVRLTITPDQEPSATPVTITLVAQPRIVPATT